MPLHCPFDLAIDLMLGSMPPDGCLFSLSVTENHAIKEHVAEALAVSTTCLQPIQEGDKCKLAFIIGHYESLIMPLDLCNLSPFYFSLMPSCGIYWAIGHSPIWMTSWSTLTPSMSMFSIANFYCCCIRDYKFSVLLFTPKKLSASFTTFTLPSPLPHPCTPGCHQAFHC